MEQSFLDQSLVPIGAAVMIAYHIWLLHHVIRHPTKTVIGINAINRDFWVRAMMEDPAKNGVLSVQTFRNNIMASTLLASTAITLSSLIAVLMTSSSWSHSSRTIVYGDRSEMGSSIKFISILVCFLVAFLMTVQSIRYYSHASILINVPFKKLTTSGLRHLSPDYVARCANRGGYCWSLGLRAFYFSFPLFMWMFGPIPMFVSSFLLVFVLYFLDVVIDSADGSVQNDAVCLASV